MSHNFNNIMQHPSVSNLVDLYEPIRHLSRALRGLDSQSFSDVYHSRHGRRHEAKFSPDFDLRETPEAYYFEGEFPGVKDCSAIKLQWIDGHTLRIEGTVQKKQT
jgi:HSP20 family molecular chaperone IbpA